MCSRQSPRASSCMAGRRNVAFWRHMGTVILVSTKVVNKKFPMARFGSPSACVSGLGLAPERATNPRRFPRRRNKSSRRSCAGGDGSDTTLIDYAGFTRASFPEARTLIVRFLFHDYVERRRP